MDEQTKQDVLNAARIIRDYCCNTICPECVISRGGFVYCRMGGIPQCWELPGDENE